MYQWDNDQKEDADLAFNVGFVYRHLPTAQDGSVGILGDGRTLFAFSSSAPAQDLWEAYTKIVHKPSKRFGMILNMYAGNGQANGDDTRTIHRYGADLRIIHNKLKLISGVKVDDWGPYDYHRDFNLTFPLQLMADISVSATKPSWFVLPSTRFGLRAQWRSLDVNSNRYDTTIDANESAYEWEMRVYAHINVGK